MMGQDPPRGHVGPAADPAAELRLLRAAEEAALEPWALLQAVRDPGGRIIDFVYRDINPVAARQHAHRREELLRCSVAETLPEVGRSGLLARYAHCVDTGEPLILNNVPYHGATLQDSTPELRRYDLRGVRVEGDYLSLSWRDVNDRYEADQRITESEARYRLLAENSTDVVVHVRDDDGVVWVSPSVEEALGAPPQYWIGRTARSVIYPDDLPAAVEAQKLVNAGETVVRRLRVLDVHGGMHWAEFHARTFYDAHGDPDGRSLSFHLVDDEVATELALEEADRRRAEADTRYRRLIEQSAVATNLVSPDGRFLLVNRAMCDLFGYDPDTLHDMSWQDLTAPEDLPTGLDQVAEMLAGRRVSIRTTKRYLHADGRIFWGDLTATCVRRPTGDLDYIVSQVIDITEEVQARERLQEARDLLAASSDSMLDPQVLFEAIRDPDDRVVDFRYVSVNRAACLYLQLSEEELLGRRALDTLPNLEGSGLLARYAQCLEDGQPVILSDFSYFNEMLDETRRYDIRATRAGRDLLSLTWTDVTDRFQAASRIAVSEEKYRLLAENSSDLVVHVRDGTVIWVSPSVEWVLGAPPEYWIGREVREVVPAEDQAGFDERLAILAEGDSVQQRIRVVSIDGVVHWVHLHSKPFYNADGHMDGFTGSMRVIDDEVAAEQARADSENRYRKLIDNSVVATGLNTTKGRFVTVNQAMCDFFGYTADVLLTKTWQELTAPDDPEQDVHAFQDLVEGRTDSRRVTKEYIHADGHRIWGDLSLSCTRNADGGVEHIITQIVDITDEVETRRQLDEARRRQAATDALYRRSVDSSAVGMCLVTPEGRVVEVNDALCQFFGYDAQELLAKSWQELTAEDYVEMDLDKGIDVLAGRIDFYRVVKQYIHASGRRIWGDLSVGGVRDEEGRVELLVAQVIDITEEVKAREQLALSEERNRLTAEELQDDLDSAAHYLHSVLPGDLSGPVAVSSRYLPSRTVGGDCFDYRWLDDDHLMVYLLDVSGHGVDSALMAVSVHNMLRSGSLSAETLRAPDQVLAILNSQFSMDHHDGKYFTVWYGVYQASTGTLRYASAGHPPPILITTEQANPLANQSPPVGMFTNTAFTTDTCPVPAHSELLLYSDGAFELALPGGGQWSLPPFITLCTELARSPDRSLDTLIEKLHAIGTFTDDCSLISMNIGAMPIPDDTGPGAGKSWMVS